MPMTLENYQHYTVEDFVHDDYFRTWVLTEHPESAQFWREFQARYPQQKKPIKAARSLFLALQESQTYPDDEQGQRMWAVIEEATSSGELREGIAPYSTPPLWRWLSVAAMLLAALGLAWALWPNGTERFDSLAGQLTESSAPIIEKTNTSTLPQHLRLADGSRIIFYPGSRVSYPQTFAGDKREVILSGKGYFEVTDDDYKPFIVYTNQLVTRVVGTSFIIDAFLEDPSPSVEVSTGKVQVFTLEEFREAQQGAPQEMVLLSAHERTNYDLGKKSFNTISIPKPLKTKILKSDADFNFQNVAVAEVFKTLESSYGLRIEYDQQALKNCNITAPLTDEPLFRKLDIVCQTIGARYEVFETRIVVSGPGCEL